MYKIECQQCNISSPLGWNNLRAVDLVIFSVPTIHSVGATRALNELHPTWKPWRNKARTVSKDSTKGVTRSNNNETHCWCSHISSQVYNTNINVYMLYGQMICIYIYLYWWKYMPIYKYIYVYAVYHTAGFSIIRCILSMLKNFLTYCHALREIRDWRKEQTFVRKSACCGIILHGFEFSVWYGTWMTVLQKVKHVLRVYSPTFNIYQHIYIYILIFDTKNPSNSTHSAVTLAWYIFLFILPSNLSQPNLQEEATFGLARDFEGDKGVLGTWALKFQGALSATLFCRYKVDF